MRRTTRLAFALIGLTVLTAVGTGGYMVLEGASWLDALYMTVITISTVGYTEVFVLSDPGRIFTIGLIVSSVGLAFVVAPKYALAMFIGAIIAVILGRIWPGWTKRFLITVCAGIIVGDSLVGAGDAFFTMFQGLAGGE